MELIMQKAVLSQIVEGLRSKTLTTCSKWASANVIMGKPFPGPLGYKFHPWTKDMMDSTASFNSGQKSAQMGYSVTCLMWSLFGIAFHKESVMYLLPSKTPDATNFSATRFDPILEASPKIAAMFSDVKNVSIKRAGLATLYMMGANSRKGVKSSPTGRMVFDEYDEMPDDIVALAEHRQDGQKNKQMWRISTPRYPGFGINVVYLESTQEHFFFPCPRCGKRIELGHDNLVVTAESIHDSEINNTYIKCLECQGALTTPEDNDKNNVDAYAERKADLLKDGKWAVTGKQDPDHRGFYINQLYSPTIRPVELAKIQLQARVNKAKEQEYYNSSLGQAHEVEGARILDSQIDACQIKNLPRLDKSPSNTIITMGVDVGTWLHYEICAWDIPAWTNDLNTYAKCRVIAEGKLLTVMGFTNLDELMRQYQVNHCVIDANPEKTSSIAFAKRFWGFVNVCYYPNNMAGKTLTVDKQDGDFKISADRTYWLDMALGRFKTGSIDLPRDLSLEYRGHVKAIFRVYKEDSHGQPIGMYLSKDDDHHAHARNYAEIALPLAASRVRNSDVGAFL
jgi:hypothetical protein